MSAASAASTATAASTASTASTAASDNLFVSLKQKYSELKEQNTKLDDIYQEVGFVLYEFVQHMFEELDEKGVAKITGAFLDRFECFEPPEDKFPEMFSELGNNDKLMSMLKDCHEWYVVEGYKYVQVSEEKHEQDAQELEKYVNSFEYAGKITVKIMHGSEKQMMLGSEKQDVLMQNITVLITKLKDLFVFDEEFSLLVYYVFNNNNDLFGNPTTAFYHASQPSAFYGALIRGLFKTIQLHLTNNTFNLSVVEWLTQSVIHPQYWKEKEFTVLSDDTLYMIDRRWAGNFTSDEFLWRIDSYSEKLKMIIDVYKNIKSARKSSFVPSYNQAPKPHYSSRIPFNQRQSRYPRKY